MLMQIRDRLLPEGYATLYYVQIHWPWFPARATVTITLR
jgi:hypothetical protein